VKPVILTPQDILSNQVFYTFGHNSNICLDLGNQKINGVINVTFKDSTLGNLLYLGLSESIYIEQGDHYYAISEREITFCLDDQDTWKHLIRYDNELLSPRLIKLFESCGYTKDSDEKETTFTKEFQIYGYPLEV
jgi:hypothetical protein